MRRTGLLALLLAGTVAGGLAAQGRPRVIWTGRSGAHTWRWDTGDISARGAGRTFSLKRALFGSEKPEADDALTYYRSTARPLSVVGTTMSFRRDDYWEGGAHPSGWISYGAYDVSRPGRPLKLTDLFPDAAVRDALWNDRIVRQALADAGVTARPRTAAELVARLKGRGFGGEYGDKYAFTEDLLSQFAFHHLEGGQVAVRLCIPWNAEIYRFQSTEIGLLLRVPERLREPLRRAAAGREGFLMREGKRRFRDQSAALRVTGRQQ